MESRELQQIGAVLLEEGALTHEEVLRAIGEAGLKGTALAALLEKSHHVSGRDLSAFLAADFRIPVIEDLRKYDLYEEAAGIIPEALARRYEIVPLAKVTGILCVARAAYRDRSGLADLRNSSGLRIKVFQAEREQVLAALDRIYGRSGREIPPPKTEVGPEPATPPDRAEAVPLIAMPAPEAAADSVEEVFEPIRIDAREFAAARERGDHESLRAFEEMFATDLPLTPIRLG